MLMQCTQKQVAYSTRDVTTFILAAYSGGQRGPPQCNMSLLFYPSKTQHQRPDLAGLFPPTQGRAAEPHQAHPQPLLTPNASHNPQPPSGQASWGDGGEPTAHHNVHWWLASVLPYHCTAFVQAWTLFYFQVHQGDQGEIPHLSCPVQQSRWRHDAKYHMLSPIWGCRMKWGLLQAPL